MIIVTNSTLVNKFVIQSYTLVITDNNISKHLGHEALLSPYKRATL